MISSLLYLSRKWKSSGSGSGMTLYTKEKRQPCFCMIMSLIYEGTFQNQYKRLIFYFVFRIEHVTFSFS